MDLSLLRNGNLVTIGISDLAVSTRQEDRLVTYSLGSCAGVSFFDPAAGVGGMIHCMLPMSSNDPQKAKDKPATYVDTGVILLLQRMFDLGAERKNIICKVAGCGSPADAAGLFRVGERNYTVLKKILWKNNIVVRGERVGGTDPKTIVLDMTTGGTFLKVDHQLVEI